MQTQKSATTLSATPQYNFGENTSVFFSFIKRLESSKPNTKNNFSKGVRINLLQQTIKIQCPESYKYLIQPFETFFRDIVTPSASGPGAPFCSLLQNGEPTLVRFNLPKSVDYSAEGDALKINLFASDRTIKLLLTDFVSIFESGHLIYTISLRPSEGKILTEYELLLLQKLASPTEGTESLRSKLYFNLSNFDFSLVDLANHRLENREKSKPNFADIAQKYIFQEEDSKIILSWNDLKKGGIHINDEETFRIAKIFTNKGSEASELLKTTNDPTSKNPARNDSCRHISESENPDGARAYSLSGLLQNVLDFHRQDASEIYDSFDPAYSSEEFSIFANSTFIFEIATNSRSYRQMRDIIGGCPYLILTHLSLAYNEELLTENEQFLEFLRYSNDTNSIRSTPIKELSNLVEFFDTPFFGNTKKTLSSNVETRMKIFRELNLHYIPNIFRYETEKTSFYEISANRGLTQRKEIFKETISQYQSLTQDVHYLQTLTSEKRISIILFSLALMGVASIAVDGHEIIEKQYPEIVKFSALGAMLFAGLLLTTTLLRAGFRLAKASIYHLGSKAKNLFASFTQPSPPTSNHKKH